MREGIYSAEEALARLVAGNERFVRGKARFPIVQKEILADLAKAQRPYATVLGCSDSRVPPERGDAGTGETACPTSRLASGRRRIALTAVARLVADVAVYS
jgi:hypothetical protein